VPQRAGPELGRDPAHRHRVQPFPVRDRDGRRGDLLAGTLSRPSGTGMLTAQPDHVAGILLGHLSLHHPGLRTLYPNGYPILRTAFAN
jgi:hypothetical protein